MKGSISSDIRGGVPDFENAKDFLDSVEEQFQSSSKALATTLIIKMVTSKYNGLGGVRGHILRMNDMAPQLKAMDMEEEERFKAETPDSAHFTTQRLGKKRKLHGKDKRHVKKNNDGNKAKTSGSKTRKCNFCHEPTYFQKDCPKFKEWLAKKGKMSSYVCYESFLANVPTYIWWIDSGASVHITCSSQEFRFMRKLNKGECNILV
ncbi:hypothetical protein ZIOFF_036792 [Zingiber officinale]|uniref:Uncharacterized protein n=1 Tax=Zingiber officinale TaxID=94328 RepID=A0A8J5L2X9_ZINOF|nr:hypothetical protein ZIOFF_036792 [Zingiber officinale]